MSSDPVKVAVPGAAQVVARVAAMSQVVAPVVATSDLTIALRNLHQPIVLLLDLHGAAIEDADHPGEYWTITPQENEAHP